MNDEESSNLVDKMCKFIGISKEELGFVCGKLILCRSCGCREMSDDRRFILCCRDNIISFWKLGRLDKIANPFFGKSLEEIKIMIDLNT